MRLQTRPDSAPAVNYADARRRRAIGLLILAAILLIVILLRAPAHLLFPAGWWRL